VPQDAPAPAPGRVLAYPELKPYGVPFTRQHLSRLEAAGQFPARIQLGRCSVGWLRSEIDEWLSSRARGPIALQRGRRDEQVGARASVHKVAALRGAAKRGDFGTYPSFGETEAKRQRSGCQRTVAVSALVGPPQATPRTAALWTAPAEGGAVRAPLPLRANVARC
jgi:prophage regulatory protein